MVETNKTREQQRKELQAAHRKPDQPGLSTIDQKNLEFFAKAFLFSPDMIFICTAADGVYVEVNDAYTRNTGYSSDELIGRTIYDFNFFVSPTEHERMLTLLKERDSFLNEEFTFRVRSGEIQQWLCSNQVFYIGSEKYMMATAIDITERRRIEQELRESQQILGTAFHASPQAIAITTLKDGKFIEVNRSHEILCGYSRDELIGHTAVDMNIWESMEERDRIFRVLKTKGYIKDEMMNFRDKAGKMHKALFSAEIIKLRGEVCMIGSSTDLTEREQIAEALRISEEKFSRAFISSPIAMCLFDVDGSRFLEINDSFTRFTGYKRKEAVGKTPDDLGLFVSDEERERMGKHLREKGTLSNIRIRSRMKSGEVRTGLFSAQVFEINGQRNMILSINDITEQVKAEEAIKSEETFRRILVQNSRDGIVILEKSGKVFEANRRFCEMLGYSPAETAGLYVWDWDTRWDRDNLIGQLNKVGESGDHFETWHKRKDGTIIDVEISTNGATIGGKKLIFCVCRDITQRKQMEKALRESEEKFSKAFHAGPEITAITTYKEGTYIDLNENYCLATGYSRDELIGRKARSMGVWVNQADRLDMIESIEKQGKVTDREYKFRIKSGEIRTWQFSAEKITLGGEPCLLGVAIDITEQKINEAKAREAESLKETDRLRRELLANVSHELRTPLAGIKGFTSMMLDYGKRLKASEKQEYLETIDKNADRLTGLIEQLLEVSRLGVGMLPIEKKTSDIGALCRAAAKEARERIHAHTITLDLPKRLPKIEVDDKRIKQVLSILLDNSGKFSSPNSEIAIKVRKNEQDLLFTVIDHGKSFPKEDAPHIFERILTRKSQEVASSFGAGLGLTMCKGLVEAHGGKIWFEFEPGEGTKCFFTLPLKRRRAVKENEKPGEKRR